MTTAVRQNIYNIHWSWHRWYKFAMNWLANWCSMVQDLSWENDTWIYYSIMKNSEKTFLQVKKSFLQYCVNISIRKCVCVILPLAYTQTSFLRLLCFLVKNNRSGRKKYGILRVHRNVGKHLQSSTYSCIYFVVSLSKISRKITSFSFDETVPNGLFSVLGKDL